MWILTAVSLFDIPRMVCGSTVIITGWRLNYMLKLGEAMNQLPSWLLKHRAMWQANICGFKTLDKLQHLHVMEEKNLKKQLKIENVDYRRHHLEARFN